MSALLGFFGLTIERQGRKILNSVSGELDSGRVVSLIGPNGSGKTTLLKVVAGLFPWSVGKDEGIVKYSGRDFVRMSARERAARITYVGASLFSDFPITGYQAVEIGRFTHPPSKNPQAIQSAMDLTQTWDLRDRLLNTMSSGELQRIAIARALAQDAKVMIFDESLSQMDLHFQLTLGALLKEQAKCGKLILWVAHDVNLALRFADECLVMREGMVLAQGQPGRILTNDLIREVYPHRAIAVEENNGRYRVSY